MKKKVLMALLLGLCVTAAGCSQKKETTEAPTEVSTEAPTEKGTEAGSESTTEKNTEAAKAEEPEYKALDYVTLGQYKALEVTVGSLEVTEADIQEQYFNDCKSFDKLEQVKEGTVADGDATNIDYVGSVDGVEFNGGTDKGADLTIGSGKFIPGFEEGLIGAKIGEKVDVNVTFPENYQAAELAGKDAVFAVTVNFVNKAPEMNDELVAEISESKTVEEYRKAVEEQLRAGKEMEQESEVINGILNLLYSGSKINEYPKEVVDFRVAQMKDYYRQIAEQSGMEFKDFLDQQLRITEEQFNEQLPMIIQQSMIQELLLKSVAETEQMELTEEEFQAGLEKYTANSGMESKEAFLAKYPEAEVRKNMLLDNVLMFLKDNTTVKVEGESASENSTEAEASETTTEAVTTEAAAETAATEAETTEAASETAAE